MMPGIQGLQTFAGKKCGQTSFRVVPIRVNTVLSGVLQVDQQIEASAADGQKATQSRCELPSDHSHAFPVLEECLQTPQSQGSQRLNTAHTHPVTSILPRQLAQGIEDNVQLQRGAGLRGVLAHVRHGLRHVSISPSRQCFRGRRLPQRAAPQQEDLHRLLHQLQKSRTLPLLESQRRQGGKRTLGHWRCWQLLLGLMVSCHSMNVTLLHHIPQIKSRDTVHSQPASSEKISDSVEL